METAVLYNVPHEIPWKIYIPLYFYFTGLSAGSFILSTLSTVFGVKRFKPMALPAAIISFFLLLLAPACLILDLHQPTRFWHTLVPEFFNNTSALSYGSWLLTLYPIANLVYIYFIFVKNDRITKILGTFTVPLAIFVHAYTGFAFALVRARAWWHSALMPGYFLTSALLSGIALLFVVALAMDRFRKEPLELELYTSLRWMMVGILLTDLFWNGSFWLTLLVSNADGHASILYALHEKLYLWGEVIMGMLVPLGILVVPWTRENKVWVCLASILIICGVFLMRYSVVFIGFDIPLS
ncbi:NrfD/PsrC family molybdoenzyme membrane anchor subunit [Desulfomonile tiedjei]|uniref:Polysulfide reductase n=1 Tax=Desulfomonile tiedjei (strain ATCC 49306 / DSM 6799 / DCB-1) TaxID=706587 RepID=I4CC59_DESTA|nr:NrfD/PsrC family molybdoenzyme membrane anchor subunit [Desulfomonile tiedjei]AFM27150.1 polysulfide reductase [Desulfomonile tiedjei DSM 6799]